MGKFSLKKPWLFTEAKRVEQSVSEKEIYFTGGLEKESQFKKPYLANNHPESELLFTPPGKTPPDRTALPGPGDCQPVGDAVGGGAPPCQPEVSCGQWVWTCAHRITKFSVMQGNGWLQSIQYGGNDTVTVTVCWNEGDTVEGKVIGSLVETPTGAVFKAAKNFDACKPTCPSKASGCTLCTTCPIPVIGYTSKQMSVGATQALTHASGGSGGPYTWAANYGTFDTPVGTSVNYTAPASNANCSANPIITLTDCCGSQGVLFLAVNQWSDTSAIAWRKCCVVQAGPNYCITDYTCLGVLSGRIFGGDWNSLCLICDANCGSSKGCYGPTGACTIYGVGPGDLRTAAMIAGGCCPQQML